MSVSFAFSSEGISISLCGSSKLANSSGVYYFVVKSVTRIEPIKTAAPMINDNFKFKGILPGTALLEMSNHFVKT